MSIQVAGGTIVNNLHTSDGTRGDLQSWVATQLAAAGWSVVSGGGSSDVLLQSADTPAGFHCQIRCFDPGSGNCPQFTMRDVAGLRISSICYMLPTNGTQFRIIANKYQFLVFATGATASTNSARVMMFGGVPYLPADIAALTANMNCYWFLFTGSTDTSTTNYDWHFRKHIALGTSWPPGATLFNDVLTTYTAGTTNRVPHFATFCTVGSTSVTVNQWKSGAYMTIDALLCWGSAAASTEEKIYGQMWDACLIMGAGLDGEVPVTIPSGMSFLTINHQPTVAPIANLAVKIA